MSEQYRVVIKDVGGKPEVLLQTGKRSYAFKVRDENKHYLRESWVERKVDGQWLRVFSTLVAKGATS